MNSYRYYSLPSKTTKTRWRCCSHSGQGCSAFIVTMDDEVITMCPKHNHPPTAGNRGKRMLRINGYTYYASTIGPKIRWRCSTHAYCGCNAAVQTYRDEIVVIKDNHTHPPRN
ncbi:unnamed protein product, partial [Iphiclides podalirius]